MGSCTCAARTQHRHCVGTTKQHAPGRLHRSCVMSAMRLSGVAATQTPHISVHAQTTDNTNTRAGLTDPQTLTTATPPGLTAHRPTHSTHTPGLGPAQPHPVDQWRRPQLLPRINPSLPLTALRPAHSTPQHPRPLASLTDSPQESLWPLPSSGMQRSTCCSSGRRLLRLIKWAAADCYRLLPAAGLLAAALLPAAAQALTVAQALSAAGLLPAAQALTAARLPATVQVLTVASSLTYSGGLLGNSDGVSWARRQPSSRSLLAPVLVPTSSPAAHTHSTGHSTGHSAQHD